MAKKKGGSAVERFLVKPDYAYPNTRMNRDELRAEMNKPSSYFHDLCRNDNEIGLLKLEILQCIGLPRLDAVGENDTFCLAVCGSNAFKTDTSPPNANPMWLSKMRRACIFPLYHAYSRLYVGVLDDDGEGERDDFAGRIVLDIARMRPNCTYDVTLPLRQSGHVYMRRPRGAIRIRFHVSWYSERAAMLSYLPKGPPKFEPHESVTVNCCDKKSFQNVALVVHGTHPQGRFSMKLVKALVREINFTRIHILRYLRKQEFRNLRGWRNPLISGFLFVSWMHSVYANTVRYVPGNLITFLLLYLWKNYANYAINESLHQGFMPPTWEEMFMALLFGTESNEEKQYLQPLEMTLKEEDESPPVASDEGVSVCCSGGCTLDEVATAFRKGVQVSTHRYGLRVYRKTFTGTKAVDFLVNSGYASSREEAVSIGRQLADQNKLLEHVHRQHEFKDAHLFYHFIIQDDSKYICTTHEPRGKGLLRSVGFLDESRNFAENQLEMPYANGADHPRFTVKESLVIRSKDSRSMMEKLMAENEEDNDAAELDLDGCLDFDGAADPRRMEKFDGYFDLDRDPSSRTVSPDSSRTVVAEEEEDADDTIVTVKQLKKPPLQNIDYKTKSDRAISDVLAEARNKVHGVLLHCFNDRTYTIRDNEVFTTKEASTTDGKRGRRGRKSDESLASPSEREGGKTPVSRRTVFQKSSGNKNKSSGRTRKSDESLESIPESEIGGSTRSRGSAFQRTSSDKSNSPRKGSRRRSSDTKAMKEENDRLLKTGAYSNANRWVAKLGVIVQPIVEIAYEWLFLFRALFNIFTWQDPILSFWISIIGPIIAIILHLFPWRIVLGVTGVVLFGPQNWLLRIMRERKGVAPPDMDTIIRRKKKQPDGTDIELTEEPLFCNSTNENSPLDYATLDQTNVKHIAVPYSPLLYSHRFYDWPPEPDYARVLKEDPQAESEAMTSAVKAESFRTSKATSTASTKGKRKWRNNISAVVRIQVGGRRAKKKGA